MLVIDPAWGGKVQFYELLFGTWTVYIFLVLLWEKVLRAPLPEWRYVLMNFMGAGAFWINHYFQKAPLWMTMRDAPRAGAEPGRAAGAGPAAHGRLRRDRDPGHSTPSGDSRTTLAAMKITLAGRSARRRIRYGYHCSPNGMYTRTRHPSASSSRCRSRRTPCWSHWPTS